MAKHIESYQPEDLKIKVIADSQKEVKEIKEQVKDIPGKLEDLEQGVNDFLKAQEEEWITSTLKLKDFAQKTELKFQTQDILNASAKKFGVEGEFKTLDALLAHPAMKARLQTFLKIGKGDQMALMKLKQNPLTAPKDVLWLVGTYAKNSHLSSQQQKLLQKAHKILKENLL